MRRSLALALAVATCLLVRPAVAADPVEIPVIISLTGSSSFQGRAQHETLLALEDQVNRAGGIGGRPLSFHFYDEQGSPQIAVQLMNGFIAQKVSVILGPGLASTCQAMAALIKDGPVQYCFTPSVHPDEGSYLFSALPATSDAIDVSLHYFRDQNIRRIAVITATDASGQDADRSIDASLASMHGDVTVVDREHFNSTDISVAAQIAKIKGANPQLVVAWSTGSPMATIFRALKEAAFDAPVLMSYSNGVYALMTQQWTAFLPANLYIAAQPNLMPGQVTDRATKAALAAHFAALSQHSIQPDVMSGGLWDCAMLVVDALRKLGPNATSAQVRDFIAGQRSWAGIFGRYDFKAVPQRGIARNALYMARWDASKQVWVGVSRAGGVSLK